jgi:hypothetical protein
MGIVKVAAECAMRSEQISAKLASFLNERFEKNEGQEGLASEQLSEKLDNSSNLRKSGKSSQRS